MARVREVWAHSLEAEMRNIRSIVERYPFISLDTEFPGVVARPMGSFKTNGDVHYQTMRCNVDLLKILQLGITFCDAQGNFPEDVTTWQFNFHFDLAEDMCTQKSEQTLEAIGFDFDRSKEYGIDPNDFAELVTTSGLMCNDNITWLSYHSGYDFGYFVKTLSGDALPASENTFFRLLHIWFPVVFDIKSVARSFDASLAEGNLRTLADKIEVKYTSSSQGAGVDSYLTAQSYFKLRTRHFAASSIPSLELNGRLFGLGAQASVAGGSGSTTTAERAEPAPPSTAPPSHAVPITSAALGTAPQGLGGPQTAYGAMAANGAYMRQTIGQR